MYRFNSANRGFTSRNRGFTLIEVLVALSILALTIAGLGQVQQAAFRHITVTQEIQLASHHAAVHLHRLNNDKEGRLGIQTGEYGRGVDLEGYPWRLNLELLPQGILAPASVVLSDKTLAVSADLSVWVDGGARELRFHTLLLRKPDVGQTDVEQRTGRPDIELSIQ